MSRGSEAIPAHPSVSLENMQVAAQTASGRAELRQLRQRTIEGRAELVRIHDAQMAVIDELLARFAVVLDGGVAV